MHFLIREFSRKLICKPTSLVGCPRNTLCKQRFNLRLGVDEVRIIHLEL